MAQKASRSPPQEVQGSVQSVVGVIPRRRERDKRYVVVNVSDPDLSRQLKSTVTFTLTKWQGSDPPEPGQIVIMSGLAEFEKGWRARSARPKELE